MPSGQVDLVGHMKKASCLISSFFDAKSRIDADWGGDYGPGIAPLQSKLKLGFGPASVTCKYF